MKTAVAAKMAAGALVLTSLGWGAGAAYAAQQSGESS